MSEASAQLTQSLLKAIEVSKDQRITFADFMEQVLYAPYLGYYWVPKIGGAGQDFFTAVSLGPDFGELLAEQLAQMWQILGQPEPFHLVEMGPGQGLLAMDVLGYLQRQHPGCFAAVTYFLVEGSGGLRSHQQNRLADWSSAVPIAWKTLSDLPEIVGCAFSNELVDAFPVHQVAVKDGQLQEVFVTAADRDATAAGAMPFREVLGETSTPRIQAYFERLGIDWRDYPDGYRTEVNLAAVDWLGAIAAKLHQGYLLTIDYGYPAHRYYNPMRTSGTLQCYFQHRHHSNPYVNLGQQDITAHVDFTTLEQVGESLGLKTVGFTPQALFLMSLGLGERMANLSQTSGADLRTLLQRRDSLRQLIDPAGMGNFGVLMQSQGLSEAQQAFLPQGFVVPPMTV
ncbi:MAG: class I SAM-dependent methyltransferase [Cyanobacteria bacterium P01_D01_bin.14]